MADYQTALRQRLASIADIREEQTTYERMKAARDRQKSAYQQQLAYQQQIVDANRRQNLQGSDFSYSSPIGRAVGGIATSATGAAGQASKFNQFLGAISGQESGGNYNARNRDSGAMGKYQIMPSNIQGAGGWDKEALGYDISTTQFMSSPEIQEKIATYKLQQYYNKYGPAGAAIAWYAGPGVANKYQNTGYASSALQGKYPSIETYMQKILGRMR